MKNKDVLRKIFLIAGSLLLLVSLVFLTVSLINSRRLSVNRDGALEFIENVMPSRSVGLKEVRSNSEMPSVSFDGQDYVALLSINRFSVKLPVRSVWDKAVVEKIPCRFTGNPYDGSLIIGGTDSDGQFDFISRIDIGDEISVTDMKGLVFTYKVSTVKHAKNAKADTLIDEDYDLTLFAKDKKSGDWLLVRCKMK